MWLRRNADWVSVVVVVLALVVGMCWLMRWSMDPKRIAREIYARERKQQEIVMELERLRVSGSTPTTGTCR